MVRPSHAKRRSHSNGHSRRCCRTVHGRRTFEIGIVDDELACQWTFAGERSEMSMVVERVVVSGDVHTSDQTLRYLLPVDAHAVVLSLAQRVRGLTYITAERVGPREFYTLEDRQAAPVVGPMGEHAVSVLHNGRDEHVMGALVLEGAPPTRLRQVEQRMRTLFPGSALGVLQVPRANAITLGLRTSDSTDFHRPIHVGFGLTQILPIVVAALSATNGDILLIENPEVHLHPAGQALMGSFLAEVAAAGVQVIVETHSDHVLNGIRRSVKSGNIAAEGVALHFFRPPSTEADQVLSPTLDKSGNVDFWPDGFFDQFDKDMNYFAGWGQ